MLVLSVGNLQLPVWCSLSSNDLCKLYIFLQRWWLCSKQCKNISGNSQKSQFPSLMRKSVPPLYSHDLYNVQDEMAQSFLSVGTHLTLSPHSHYKWGKLLTWLKCPTASLKFIWLFSARNSPSSQHKTITVTPFLKHWGHFAGLKLILLLSCLQS